MTDLVLPAGAARTVLTAVIREQLAAAYAAGVDMAPHNVNALADREAPRRFTAISTAAEEYALAVVRDFRDHLAAGAKQGSS